MEFEDLPTHEGMFNPKSRRVKRSKHKGVKRNEHKSSSIEKDVAYLLCKLGVEFKAEKTFPGLCSILFPDQLLPLDFYLPKLRAVIELDGVHHRKKVASDKHNYSLDRRILNDKTRDLFCLKRGFKMLRINDLDFKNYKEIITEFINSLKSS